MTYRPHIFFYFIYNNWSEKHEVGEYMFVFYLQKNITKILVL